VAALVSLITVNLDGLAHLEAFLPSVGAQDYPADLLEIILVDNGSSDGSLAWLKTHYPHVQVIGNPRNLGFARANNQGAAVARGRYLLLLNNDMHLERDFISALVAAKERLGAEVACLGARILDWHGELADFVGSGMTFEGKGLQIGHGEPADSPVGRGTESELLFACGGALLVDAEVYRTTGGLDEDFFAYYEDLDFGWRLWVLGYRVMLCPKAIAYHRHNGTSRRFGRHKKEVLLERNAMSAMLKNYDERSLATFWPAALLLAVKRLAVRSGLERAEWAFAPDAVPSPVLASRERTLSKLVRVWRRDGLRRVGRKALWRLGELLLRRFGPASAPSDGTFSVAVRPEAYATAVAIEDLLDNMAGLLAKRQTIQAARRRTDGEIFRLFALPFQAVEGLGHYPETERALREALGLDTYFEARQAEALAGTSAHGSTT
jgi:GT2 family glycosyltransferase